MKKKSGKDVPLLPQANIIPSGVVHLVQRQEEGWACIRPQTRLAAHSSPTTSIVGLPAAQKPKERLPPAGNC